MGIVDSQCIPCLCECQVFTVVSIVHRRQSTFQLKGAVPDLNLFVCGDSLPPTASLLGHGVFLSSEIFAAF